MRAKLKHHCCLPVLAACAAAGPATLPATAPATHPAGPTAYLIPDHSGTMALPAGWSASSTSVLTGVYAVGPAGQRLLVDGLLWVSPPPTTGPAPNVFPSPARSPLTGPFTDPAAAVPMLVPQFDRLSRAAGGPGEAFGRFLAVHELKPTFPDGKAALLDYTYTLGKTPYRSVARVECDPSWRGWTLRVTEVSAPADRFDTLAAASADVVRSLRSDEGKLADDLHVAIERERQWNIDYDLNHLGEKAYARFLTEREARRTRLVPFETYYPAWAGGPTPPATQPAAPSDAPVPVEDPLPVREPYIQIPLRDRPPATRP
jgi:hypothetical protein